ncbi:MAG: hypothetical protein IKU26_06065 [Clostridia bacterium]|nr:hypothetical protein [Clostridia bacterium]
MKKWIVSLLLICTLVSVLSIRVCAMQLFVHIAYDGGKYITLEVEPTDRIEDLKEKIFDQEGISVEDQILMFATVTILLVLRKKRVTQ